MKKMAMFEKVSYDRFRKDLSDVLIEFSEKISINEDKLSMEQCFANIMLPKRATLGSAGYDFVTPFDFTLAPGESIKIPTGIRVKIDAGWVLKIYPRSSLGFKYSLQLNNTVGIIDSDYYYSDNEGHIFVKITNASRQNKTLFLKAGDAFCQGVFVEYGITYNDEVSEVRNGGEGSTNKIRKLK